MTSLTPFYNIYPMAYLGAVWIYSSWLFAEKKDAVDLNRLIYLLLTIQLNRLTAFWVPLLPKPLIQILAAVAEAEHERILERTNDGRIAALAAGVKFGRKKHPRTPTALELISQGESLGSVTEKTGISRSTYFRLKRTIKNDAKIATFSK